MNDANDHIDNFMKENKVYITERDTLIEKVKEKYPNEKLFYTYVPYNGFYFYRRQTMAMIKDVAVIVEESSAKSLAEFRERNKEVIDKLKDTDLFPQELQIEIDIMRDDAADISNFENIRRCVVYPENIGTMIDDGSIPSGFATSLIGNIFEVSGWGKHTEIKEI